MRRRKQYPIRDGCYVEFVHTLSTGYQRLVSGHVVSHSYGEHGLHTFTIKSDKGPREITVSGRLLYTNLLRHDPGEAAKIEYRRDFKQKKKQKRVARRRRKRQFPKSKRKAIRRHKEWKN